MFNCKLLVCLVFMFCLLPQSFAQEVNVSGEGSKEIIAQLDKMRSGLEDGLQTSDMEQLLSFAHPKLVVTWQNGEVSKGVGEVQKFLERMLVGDESVVTKIDVEPIKVDERVIFSDGLISLGSLKEEYHLREGDLVFTLNSQFSAWIVQDGGRYLLRGLHLSANVFDNPIQDLVSKKASISAGVIGFGGRCSFGFAHSCSSSEAELVYY